MESEFMRMQREATEQLRRMNKLATPPKNEEKEAAGQAKKRGEPALFKDEDKTLLLFLLLLLAGDGADPVLMLALLYLML